MWGRSSSGPAAAASLQTVSSESSRTSATAEGRPAGAGGTRAVGRRVQALLRSRWCGSREIAMRREVTRHAVKRSMGMVAGERRHAWFGRPHDRAGPAIDPPMAAGQIHKQGGGPAGPGGRGWPPCLAAPAQPTFLEQQGQGDAHRLPALAGRRQLLVRKAQRQAPHAPAGHAMPANSRRAAVGYPDQTEMKRHRPRMLAWHALPPHAGACRTGRRGRCWCGPSPCKRDACQPHALLDVVNHTAGAGGGRQQAFDCASKGRWACSLRDRCKAVGGWRKRRSWRPRCAAPHRSVISHSAPKCGCSCSQRRPCSRGSSGRAAPQ